MNIFIANLSNELRKIRVRKKYLVFLIIEVMICVLCGGVSVLIGRAADLSAAPILLANMPMSMLSFFIQIYVPLIIFMAACDLFAGEVYDGTVRAVFMRPVSRLKQYFSKVAAILVLAVTYLAVLFLLTVIMKGAAAHSVAGLLPSFLSYFLDILPLLVLILMAALVNQISGSPSLSVILCVILYVGLIILGIVIPQLSGLLFTGYMQWHNLWVGVTLPFSAMMSKIGILVGFAMVFGCAGYYLFERREV